MTSLSLADCAHLLARLAEMPAAQARHEVEQVLREKGILAAFEAQQGLDPDTAAFVRALLAVVGRREDEERAAQQMKERMEMLSSASFEGILVHEDGVVIDVNDRLGELLRAEPRDLLGPRTMHNCVAPEDLPGVLERVTSGYEGAYVISGVRHDGSRFRAELQSKQGRFGDRPVRIAAVRDVTERERTLELLRESEQRFKDLTETAFDLCVASRDGIVVELRGSLERFLGYSPGEVLGRPVVDFVAPSARLATEQALDGKTEGAYFSTLISKLGEVVPVEVIGVNSSLGGVPTRMAGVRDLRPIRRIEAERWQLQHQVERMQRLDSLGLLAGGIAHDFNNLLVGVIGNAELLLMAALPPDSRDLASGILSAGQRATDLTRRLLAYSGRGEVAPPRALDVGELVTDLDSLVSSARAKGIVMTTNIEPGTAVMGDRTTLLQVLLNLSTNAIDALESSRGRVEIRARRVSYPDARFDDAIGATVRPGSWVLLEVEDDGVGMDDVTKSRIFEPFFSTKERGHGLGLAACLGILRGHGGALHVESAPHQGSCFSLLLPAAEPVDRGTPRQRPSDIEPCCVLVVDDHPMVRAQMRRSLELRGFTVFDAEDGQACLEHLERRRFDLILLDMTMPGLAGPEVLRTIRRRGLMVPVVLTSGYTLSAEALDAGSFQAFLQKPYGIGELMEAIERARRVPG
jgi:PAS domain S-box-containing protein